MTLLLSMPLAFLMRNKECKSGTWSCASLNRTSRGRKGDLTSLRHLNDILEFLRKCDNEQVDLPTFVIISPMEVPVNPAAAYSKLAYKVTLMETTLKTICDKVTSYDLNFPSLPNPSPHPSQKPMIVLVSNFPSYLIDPAKRK